MRRLLTSGLTVLATISSLILPIYAIQSVDQLPIEFSQDHLPAISDDNPIRPHRIAIIGAGPAGASTAYHLHAFSDTPLNITIFDRNDYIGGRTTTVNALNDPRYPVELGASIFVEINAILYNATRDFRLPINGGLSEGTDAKYELGVWDGEEFVVRVAARGDDGGWTGRVGGWWDVARLLWRYGLSPVRLRRVQQGIIGRFLRMYDEGDGFPFANLTGVAGRMDLLDVTGRSGDAVLAEAGVGEMFAREIVQASSRVNYAQNLDGFHGLETMVCMSTEGAMSIEGGNWQIFERMVKKAGAVVRLGSTVTGVDVGTDGVSHVTVVKGAADGFTEPAFTTTTEDFDTVVLAHPYDPATLKLSSQPAVPRETPEYVTLYVTLFTTPSRPHPRYFNLNINTNSDDPSTVADSEIPDTILTTLPADLDPSFLGRGPAGLGLTPFWSLSTLRVLNPSSDSTDLIPPYLSHGHIPAENLALNRTQYLYKIFSAEPVTAATLGGLFGWEMDLEKEKEKVGGLAGVSTELLTWYHEKTWESYPYLPPRKAFETFDFYAGARKGGETDEEKELKGRVWSTAPMEVFISTMETMALSGRNVARLIVDSLEGKMRS